MTFLYRRRIPTSRRTWTNVSTRGVSETARLGRVTVNSRGRVTVRIGKGLTWRDGGRG